MAIIILTFSFFFNLGRDSFLKVYKHADKLIAVLCNRKAAKCSKEQTYFVWTFAYRKCKRQSF